MRKANALISGCVVVLLLVHMIAGALQMAGLLGGGSTFLTVIAWVMLALIVLHVIIGIKLTVDSLRLVKKSGASYGKENRLFWARRISGFALMAFIACHLLIFMGTSGNGAFRLHIFAGAELTTQILMVVSLLAHVGLNMTPMLIGLGIRSFKTFLPDALAVLSALLLAAGIGFVIYFIRWSVF